ncbi:hypothetical protein U0070_020851 [Myodes glareolus]|uniref:ER lumen protein-retaining receptor n=1 Tax=Myodes glareolus TaxID=447135 RepID=A0AAW0IQF1_MYOGA
MVTGRGSRLFSRVDTDKLPVLQQMILNPWRFAVETAATLVNIFRLSGGLFHLVAIVILLLKIWKMRSVNHDVSPLEFLWTFSIYPESVAILPQLFMISKTGEVETITTHYLFFLGLFCALYLVHWNWRFCVEGFFDLIAVVAMYLLIHYKSTQGKEAQSASLSAKDSPVLQGVWTEFSPQRGCRMLNAEKQRWLLLSQPFGSAGMQRKGPGGSVH